MFTGIIEEVGKIKEIQKENGNVHFAIRANMSPELSIDQSIAHNGTCLTVVEKTEKHYWVTAIDETLSKTNLGNYQTDDRINLERGMLMSERLDGHIVQGHVDQTGVCKKIDKQDGSTVFHFEHEQTAGGVTIKKGSITVNGVSLTVVDSGDGYFSVAIIPYTLEHTNFNQLSEGDRVNLEFDVIGKYVQRLVGERN